MAKTKLEECEVLELRVKSRLTVDPNRKSNLAHLYLDSPVVVSRGGKEIGSISACIGGGITIRDKTTGRGYHISPDALWAAFEEATR